MLAPNSTPGLPLKKCMYKLRTYVIIKLQTTSLSNLIQPSTLAIRKSMTSYLLTSPQSSSGLSLRVRDGIDRSGVGSGTGGRGCRSGSCLVLICDAACLCVDV